MRDIRLHLCLCLNLTFVAGLYFHLSAVFFWGPAIVFGSFFLLKSAKQAQAECTASIGW